MRLRGHLQARAAAPVARVERQLEPGREPRVVERDAWPSARAGARLRGSEPQNGSGCVSGSCLGALPAAAGELVPARRRRSPRPRGRRRSCRRAGSAPALDRSSMIAFRAFDGEVLVDDERAQRAEDAVDAGRRAPPPRAPASCVGSVKRSVRSSPTPCTRARRPGRRRERDRARRSTRARRASCSAPATANGEPVDALALGAERGHPRRDLRPARRRGEGDRDVVVLAARARRASRGGGAGGAGAAAAAAARTGGRRSVRTATRRRSAGEQRRARRRSRARAIRRRFNHPSASTAASIPVLTSTAWP